MTLDTSIDKILGTDNRSKATYDRFNEAFEQKSVLIAIVHIPNLFTNEGSRNLFEISQTFTQIDGLKDIKSLTHSSRPVKKGFSFDISKMILLENFLTTEKKTDAQWQQLKSFITAYPMTKNLLISEDGKFAVIMAVLDKRITTLEDKLTIKQKVSNAFEKFNKKGLKIELLSEAFLAAEFHQLVNKFLIYYIMLSLIAAFLIITIIFKSLKISLIMIFYQLSGLSLFPVIFYLNRADINVYTLVIIPLISAIQLTFITHFYAAFNKSYSEGSHFKLALKTSLSKVLKPSFIAFLTSGTGLIALSASDLPILKSVGKVGILSLAAVFTLTFLPPFLYTLKTKIMEEIPERLDRDCQSPLLNRSKNIVTLFLLICLTSLFLIPKISIDIRTKEFLHENSQTRKAIETINTHFGGTNIIQLQVNTEYPLTIQEHQTLNYLHNLRQKVMNIQGVNDAYTYSQLYTTLHQLFLGDNYSTGNVLPDKTQSQLYTNLMNSLRFPFQHILQNEELNQTLFIFRTQDLPSKEILNIVNNVLQMAEEQKPEGIKIKVKDGIQSILASDRNIVNSQIKSIAWSISTIFIILTFMWRSWHASSSALLTNSVPLLLLFASMPLLGVSLNSINIMVAPLILSVAIDDAIHFISSYKQNLKKKPQKIALSLTLQDKLKPILCTSLILFFNMLFFYLAPFPPVQQFGLLGAMTILFAFITTIILLPALLFLRKNKGRDRHTVNPFKSH